MKQIILVALLLISHIEFATCQTLKPFADSIRKAYKIPELAYAVVSSEHVYELDVVGYKRLGSNLTAEQTDLFRIGSNTKAITGFIAALLVRQGKISWDTKFFDLFPEMKAKSRKEYYGLTLLNLLTFRSRLIPYTYTYDIPKKGQFTGDEDAQQYQFATWFFKQPAVAGQDSMHFSNLGYVAAGLMLKKVSGKSYKQLVTELGSKLNINFKFGQPNNIDSLEPWGHNANLTPGPPADNYKLNWLLPAGNICVNLPDYVKFIQLQLIGLSGKSDLLTKEEFEFLHFGLTRFAVGWFWDKDDKGRLFSYNHGNPGTFLTSVYVYKELDKALILFSNAQTDAVEEGMNILYEEMKRRYCK